MSERELERIRTEYAARDAAAETPYRWDNPGYVSYLQSVERALLRGLADAGVVLGGLRVLERIRTEYAARDAAAETPYRWDNPGYVSYLQSVERALLRGLADAGVALSGLRVLDVGCGTGYFLDRLREYGAGECHGIDLLENRIAEARRRYPALEWHVGSATKLPFDDGEFDLVAQFACLSSIVDRDARARSAREMRRVAGPGWVLSFDLLRPSRPRPGGTPTVGLDRGELRALFGEPRLLRRVALRFDVAQLAGRHALVAQLLELAPPLRSHLLGIWSG